MRNGDYLFFFFLLYLLIAILPYERAVPPPSFMYLFNNLYHCGLMDIYFTGYIIVLPLFYYSNHSSFDH